MSSLPSPYLAAILIAALVAALLFHSSRMLGRQRWVHAAYAAAAVGLIYLLGEGAFGWALSGQGALLWVYLALFIVATGVAARRRLAIGAIGLPWLSALLQLGVVAYMFAPESFRKPPVTAALFLYFVFEALVWLRGREEEPASADDSDDRQRPPLFPPQRRRGLAEASAAVAAIVIAYLLFVGPPAANVGSDSATAQQHELQIEQASATDETATSEQTPAAGETAAAEETPAAGETAASGETPAAGETAASGETPAESAAPNDGENSGIAGKEQPDAAPQVATSEPSPPPAPAAAKDPGVYAARAGDTFKSIAKRLYGTAKKWRALADANPELKAKRFRAGQLIKLPPAPTP